MCADPLPDHFTTIVVGAGPAGIMAARHAVRRGPVLLVDSSDLPREKSCGGMLNRESADFISEIATIPNTLFHDPRTVNFRYVDWDRGIRKPTDLEFLNISRSGLDDWLLSHLSDQVTVRGGTAFSGLCLTSGGVQVTLKDVNGSVVVTCDYLVGADGARSAVRRALGTEHVPIYATLQDHVTLSGDIEPYFDCIYMRHIGDRYAYSYVVPKGDTALVGSVYYPKTSRPHERQERTLSALRTRIPHLGTTVRREASAAACIRRPADVNAGRHRVLLAGEAGGFLSPTSGEGISFALRTGALAGQAVADSKNGHAQESYERSVRGIKRDIVRRLWWLPVMESSAGKFIGGLMPESVVSRVTRGL